MDEMENKLNAILGNPQMMQQIMSMAQAFGQNQGETTKSEESSPPSQPTAPAFNLDPGMLQKIYGIARQSGIDKNQQALLRALRPYLNRDRILKLEKAMRAARIAGVAATALNSNGISFFSGR